MHPVKGVRGLPSLLGLTVFIAGPSLVVSACGSPLPSAAPLSTSGTHTMRRTRPSSARAVEPGSDDHPSVESEGSLPSDDDDDDDSTGTSKNRQDTGNLLSR
ncbi:MAG TPA: hypothetical protein VF395_00025 [Polyangiaceae bacterium]